MIGLMYLSYKGEQMSAKKGEMPPAYERRLERAINQIRLGLYCEAVESASYGIELLMQALFDELKKANRDNRRKASKLSKAYNKHIMPCGAHVINTVLAS